LGLSPKNSIPYFFPHEIFDQEIAAVFRETPAAETIEYKMEYLLHSNRAQDWLLMDLKASLFHIVVIVKGNTLVLV
jgi:hypothetical protein